MKKSAALLLLAVAFLVPTFAGADEAWVSYHDYSYTPVEMPSGISMTAEMTATEFVMTIRGIDSLMAYMRFNLPTGTSLGESPYGYPWTIATHHGYIDAGKFKKNSAGNWELSVPKTVLCSGKGNHFFPALMIYDEENSSQQTEIELYPGSEYFKLGNGLKTNMVNHGMAMTIIDCQ
jgi:hypothetical protein